MREHKGIAIVLPVGPKDAEDAIDTLTSVLHYTGQSRIIVVIDDTGTNSLFAERAQGLSQDIVILPAPRRSPGVLGGLWVKIASAYQWLLETYQPDVILRLDVDALIIGPGLEERAVGEFAKDPRVGLLGSYRIGPDGGIRDWSWPARRLRIESGLRGLRYPARRARLRDLISLAEEHGYVKGEHPLGGGYIHRFKAADDIRSKGWFRQPWFATSRLGEDHIMGLLTVAAGYRIADFGGPGDPAAMRWRGLPAHPHDLLANHKLLTHSVRFWGCLKEAEIRRIFQEARK